MSDFVFSRLLSDSNEASKNINNYFDKFDNYNSNIYQILNQIPSDNLIIYIFIIGFIFFLFNFYEVKLNHLMTLFISILVIGYLIQKDFGDFNKYTETKKDQLKFLNKLCFDGTLWRNFGPNNTMNIIPKVSESYLYLNPLIVELFYNIREFTQYNLASYVGTLLHVNNVMGIHQQMKMGLADPFANLDLAKEEIGKAMNSLESLIYKLPISDVSENKYVSAKNLLQSILTRYVIEMEDICERVNKTDGLNIYSKPSDQLDSVFDVPANDMNTRDYNPSYNLYV